MVTTTNGGTNAIAQSFVEHAVLKTYFFIHLCNIISKKKKPVQTLSNQYNGEGAICGSDRPATSAPSSMIDLYSLSMTRVNKIARTSTMIN